MLIRDLILKANNKIETKRELKQVKREAAAELNRYGYDGEAFAKKIVMVSGYWKGKPSRVMLTDGTEIYL